MHVQVREDLIQQGLMVPTREGVYLSGKCMNGFVTFFKVPEEEEEESDDIPDDGFNLKLSDPSGATFHAYSIDFDSVDPFIVGLRENFGNPFGTLQPCKEASQLLHESE